MFFACFIALSFSIDSTYFGQECPLRTITVAAPDGHIINMQGSTDQIRFLYFYDLQDTDQVYSCSSWPNTNDYTMCTKFTEFFVKNLVYSFENSIFLIKTQQTRSLTIRGGTPNANNCPDETYMMSGKSFNIEDFMSKHRITPPRQFCLMIFNQPNEISITNTLSEVDALSFCNDGWNLENIPRGETKSYSFASSDKSPYLRIVLGPSRAERNFTFSMLGAVIEATNDFSFSDIEIKNNSVISQTSTPTPDPPTAEEESSHFDVSQSTESELSSLSESSSSESSESIQYTYTIPNRTPDETWAGNWLDPPNVIIRGDDVPEVKETYPPLQTKYIKTEVPTVKKAVAITTGTILIMVIVGITIINIYRTYRKIKSIHNSVEDSNEVDIKFSEMSDTVIYTTDYSAVSN